MSGSRYNEQESGDDKLNDIALVMRLIHRNDITNEGRIGPASFRLVGWDVMNENNDRNDIPHLSVWSKDRTKPEQARGFMTDPAMYIYWVELAVEAIRTIRTAHDLPEIYSLDVRWFQHRPDPDNPHSDSNAPGVDGHAGITGLHFGHKRYKIFYTSLRSQLVDLANKAVHEF